MKKLLAMVLLAASFGATANEITSYDCDYDFDGHTESVVVEYKENPARLVIDGKEYRQPRDTILKHKMRWQMFEGTAIIRDTFSGKLQSNSTQIKNLKCEIFGA